jgi:mercuric ion transport protein
MKINKSGIAGAGLLSAIAASLCCITPLLAFISGASGLASIFSWMDAYRPYLIGVTILVLGFAWYQKLRPVPVTEIDCACETEEKKPFLQSRTFLGIITVFAILMLAFPYYGQIFYPVAKNKGENVAVSNIQFVQYKVRGMSCKSCEAEVKNEVNKLSGVLQTNVSYEKGLVAVKFDPSKTNNTQIKNAIDKTGYKVQGAPIVMGAGSAIEKQRSCTTEGCK